ncbi:MAG: DNA-binding protein [Thermoplasmata archaeon]
MVSYVRDILSWWQINGRDFPWRRTREPYRILVSEILLHRTRAENILPVYERFLNEFPDIETLSKAELKDVIDIMRPLGLRWRALKFHQTARIIADRFVGEVPAEKNELIKLPGIGEYIASAVPIFSRGEYLPLLDVNTVRVAARFFGLPVNDGSRKNRMFREFVLKLVNPVEVRSSYYAIIDLSAMICRPREPKCSVCPISYDCSFRNKL